MGKGHVMDVKLNAPLSRGRVDAAAGDVVPLPDGLARRLIDRGHAVLHTRPVEGAPKPGRGKAKTPPVSEAPPVAGDAAE
ncbi:hypothetical protein RCCRONUS_8 [Rhodobacter phage RcCronus]|uniref:Uncharacterized protein n=2 Tax=Cronusvirus cronus TaxID=2005060 RepID=A0A0K1Y6F6_9CAUD|nr:hypothetical protein FDI78_gp08 [Rhodobacter phage RcCronus]AKU43297.1 hypothetical protein RCCRONUS_8 [Rhodobacter phage RcCronus]AKY02675.1 hypothetical protein RCSAXON_8 [Rhodobacter phage RcSaxon]